MVEALVVDASVAVKCHLPDEEDVAIANRLLVRFAAGELGLIAPDLIRHEVASAIVAATLGRSPRLTVPAGEQAIVDFLATRIDTRPGQEFILDASRLVHRYGCALYDALYLALAQRLGLPFITADGKLHRRVGHISGVIWLASYSPPAEATEVSSE